MTPRELKDLKCELVDAMLKTHGMDYTFGWLRQAFIEPMSPEIEEGVLKKTLQKLK